MADIQNGTITIKGIDELEKKLTQMRTEDPTFEKRLRGAIREILKRARKELSGDAKENLQMQGDPRSAYKAVRSSVYKRLFGGQVNILPSRRAGAMSLYEPPRTLTAGQRGGNRRPRSKRTTDLMSYQGKDRGFILRFLNAGTGDRTINFKDDPSREYVDRGRRGGNLQKYGKTINTGRRGSIAARNWFGSASQREMQEAAGKLQEIIDKVINEEFI